MDGRLGWVEVGGDWIGLDLIELGFAILRPCFFFLSCR